MEPIQIKGIELLTENEKQNAYRILSKWQEKLKRKIKGDFSLRITIKEYAKIDEKKDKKKKYSINAEILGAYRLFEASYADWDFNKTLNNVMEKLENEAEHRFRALDQHKR